MSIHVIFLMLTVFLAAGVEVVEMATIVLGVGSVRGWPSTLFGGGVGLVALAIIVGVLGPLLTRVPINILRDVVGMLLLLFGLQWLRKSIYRIARLGFEGGEEEEEEEGAAAKERGPTKVDWTAFALSFKGVFLEGLEIAFVVITFGAAAGHVGAAAVAAGAAFVVIAGISAAARKAVSRAPNNAIKFAVGILLTTYGSFWSVQGLQMSWPGGDFAVLYLLGLYTGVAFASIALLRRVGAVQGPEAS